MENRFAAFQLKWFKNAVSTATATHVYFEFSCEDSPVGSGDYFGSRFDVFTVFFFSMRLHFLKLDLVFYTWTIHSITTLIERPVLWSFFIHLTKQKITCKVKAHNMFSKKQKQNGQTPTHKSPPVTQDEQKFSLFMSLSADSQLPSFPACCVLCFRSGKESNYMHTQSVLK